MKLRTVCPHDCPDQCGIVATVEDGRVTRVDADPDHAFTQGFLCHKVDCYDERIYSPDRIIHPMVRRSKGAALERASWDEALDLVAGRMGSGESVLPYSYGGNMGLVARHAGHPFFHKIGASRLARTVCDDAADVAWKSMVGAGVGTDCERIAESDFVIVWGMNAAVVNLHAMPYVREAQRRGLSRPDLFVVVHEQTWTDTVAFADVILPACTSFESADLYRSYGHYYLQRTRPVIPPVGESKSNVEMFNALAHRYGLDDPIFSAGEEERIAMLLATAKGPAAGVDRAALDRGEPVRLDFPRSDPFEKGFPAPGGRFRFANDALPDPLPGYAPCPEGCESDLRRRFPLQLVVPPAKHFLNSTFGSVASLVARAKRPTALLHPGEASARGLADGANVRVFTERGETRASLILTEDAPPGVVVVPGIWWSRDLPGGGAAVNALTSQRLTDMGASSTFNCSLAEVEAV